MICLNLPGNSVLIVSFWGLSRASLNCYWDCYWALDNLGNSEPVVTRLEVGEKNSEELTKLRRVEIRVNGWDCSAPRCKYWLAGMVKVSPARVLWELCSKRTPAI